jgi:hypothetical protein
MMRKIIMNRFILAILAVMCLAGCMEVGGSNVGVCTGTECGEGHNDSSDNSASYGEGSTTSVTTD